MLLQPTSTLCTVLVSSWFSRLVLGLVRYFPLVDFVFFKWMIGPYGLVWDIYLSVCLFGCLGTYSGGFQLKAVF